MKLKSLTKYLTLLTISSIGSNAQALTKQELADIPADQIISAEQASKQSVENLKGSGFVTVGSDASCDYRLGNTRIQDAIDFGNSEIRIAVGIYEENVVIDDVSVALLGGYANCTDADSDVYGTTSVAASIRPLVGSGFPAIRIRGSSQRNNITLRNLSVQRGEGSGLDVGGGISTLFADAAITMTELFISQNTGIYGGGVSSLLGDTDISMYNVSVVNNEATGNGSVDGNGGGIYCDGTDNSIIFSSANENNAATIIGNSAENGGGAYITGRCAFTSFVGSSGGSDLRGFIGNTASNNGGGIYAGNGAKVNLRGDGVCALESGVYICRGYLSEPVNLEGNIADSDNSGAGNGGAIYAASGNTEVYAVNVNISGNSADYGGAVAVNSGALFTTDTSYLNNPFDASRACWSIGRCNQYTRNKSSETGGRGGAFYAKNGGRLKVTRTHIEGNRADFGSAFYLIDSNTDLDLEGSYITGNGSATADGYGDLYAVRLATDASARIDYTTIADNFVPSSSASLANSNSSLRIFSSIVHDLSGADALSESSPVASVERGLIVNAMGDVNSGSANVVDDPEFVDRANNDYHIDAMFSPAVDYNDELSSQAEHTTQDTDRENRGWDDYVASNNFQGSRYDVGADETYQNDVIFEDEFE